MKAPYAKQKGVNQEEYRSLDWEREGGCNQHPRLNMGRKTDSETVASAKAEKQRGKRCEKNLKLCGDRMAGHESVRLVKGLRRRKTRANLSSVLSFFSKQEPGSYGVWRDESLSESKSPHFF